MAKIEGIGGVFILNLRVDNLEAFFQRLQTTNCCQRAGDLGMRAGPTCRITDSDGNLIGLHKEITPGYAPHKGQQYQVIITHNAGTFSRFKVPIHENY